MIAQNSYLSRATAEIGYCSTACLRTAKVTSPAQWCSPSQMQQSSHRSTLIWNSTTAGTRGNSSQIIIIGMPVVSSWPSLSCRLAVYEFDSCMCSQVQLSFRVKLTNNSFSFPDRELRWSLSVRSHHSVGRNQPWTWLRAGRTLLTQSLSVRRQNWAMWLLYNVRSVWNLTVTDYTHSLFSTVK